MATKKTKRTEASAATTAADAIDCRNFTVRAQSTDTEARTVRAVIATEQPVLEMDWERMEMVPRVLLSDGMEMPGSQVPLLDSHSRYSVENQLGSVRGVERNGGEVVGVLNFSSAADEAFTKVREGHITDVSAGFKVIEERYVPRGRTETINGRRFDGPLNVATKWQLREASITPIGADDQAKIRGLSPQLTERVRSLMSAGKKEAFAVNEELRLLCVERGMSADLTDIEAQEWMLRHFKSEPAKKAIGGDGASTPAPEGEARKAAEQTKVSQLTGDEYRKLIDEALELREQKRSAFRKEIDGLCELANVPTNSRFYDATSVDEARKLILDERNRVQKEAVPGGTRIEFGESGRDVHRAALGTALVQRALDNTACSQATRDKVFPVAERSKNAGDFKNASLYDIACECLRADGFSTRNLTREQVAMAAMGWPEKAGLRSDYPSYHSSGSFALITADAVNKSMQVGYTEFPSTWRGPFRQAASVPDFKTIHRLRLGTTPNLPVWIDQKGPDRASFSEAEETYAVEAYSLQIDFSWRLLVNDDMDALSRGPSMLGMSAARTVNAVAWASVLSNPTMSDGAALFLETPAGNRKRKNLTTGAATPTTSTIAALKALMRLMRAENTPEGSESEAILNLSPRFLVVPTALETTAQQLVLSMADPNASQAGVYNPNKSLEVIVEPLLDANSAKAFYLIASPSQIDTAEVTFLQGQESPVTRNWVDERTLSHSWAVVQTFAAKAMNHRGFQKHAGE